MNLFAVCCIYNLSATTLYLSPSGNDKNSGTKRKPFVLTVLDASGNCAAVCASQKIAVNNDDRQFFTDISPIELSEYISDETFENIVYHNKGLLYLRNAWLNVSANIDFNFADLSAAEKTGFK